MKANEATEVRDSMAGSSVNPDGTRKVIKKPTKTKQASADVSELRKINNTHQIALRALKKKCDNVTQDLLTFSKELPKLHEKGYPETMQQFMQGKVDEVGAVVAEGNTLYAKFVFDSAESNPDNRHAKAAQTK